MHSKSSILEIIEAHGVSLGKNFFNTESREFNLGVEPKWVNRSNITADEANALGYHPDYSDVTYDFRDMENAKAVFEQVKLFQEALRAWNLSAEQILEYSRRLDLLSQKLGGVDLGQLIKDGIQLTDEQLYRSGVNSHRVLMDVDGKPVVAIPNHPYDDAYKHSNGERIQGGMFSTIALSPNLWIAREGDNIAQSPYGLHRHEFNQYGYQDLPSKEDFRDWERSPLNHHTQQRFGASLVADYVYNQLSSDKAKLYGFPKTKEEIEAEMVALAEQAAMEEAARIEAENIAREEQIAADAAAQAEREVKLKKFAPRFAEPETQAEIQKLMTLGKKVFMVSSYEWERVYSAIRNVGAENAQDVLVYDAHKGIRKFGETGMEDAAEAQTFAQAAGFFESCPEPIILIVNNFDEGTEMASKSNLAIMQGLFRDYNYGESADVNKNMVLCSQTKFVPGELSEELSVVDVKLPDKYVLYGVAMRAMEEMGVEPTDIPESTISAALGLTTMQADEAFKKALLERGQLGEDEIGFIIKQKEAIINRSGVLEVVHPRVNLDDVGGYDNFKEWLRETEDAFSPEAREFGIPTPRGVLALGIPGTGKSLGAKAIASEWKLPLVKFDMGKAFGSLVGESEQKMRYALDVASSMAPCLLWVDEIEKGLSGLESSGRSDGGTSARVFGSFLTWMQEKQEEVFVYATANDVSKLPPELLRKGRFDEIFFMDLPSQTEIAQILSIHLNNVRDDSKDTELMNGLSDVIASMDGFTGAEIESVVSEGMKKAFRDPGRLLTAEHLAEAARHTRPSSVTMKEKINAIRMQAQDRFRYASSENEGGLQQ